MSSLFIVCLLSIVMALSENDTPFTVNRVHLTKNTAKQTSIRFHGFSTELILIHATLKFSSPVNTRHNSLFISQSSLYKYTKILQEDTQKILVTSRAVKKVLSYLTLSTNATDNDVDNDGYNDRLDDLFLSIRYLGMKGPQETTYDGVFLLDAYSAIWDDYNIAVFTEHLVTFRYVSGGSLSQPQDDEVREFSGVVRLPCDVTFDSDKCLTNYTGVVANGRLFPLYRLVIDLDSERNILPIDLYLFLYQGRVGYEVPLLRLDFDKTQSENTIILHREFQYDVHESNIIVLGVDLLHHFPRLEYSLSKREFQIWYHREEVENHDTYEMVKIVFMVFNLLLMVSLFVWGTSYNYLVLDYMIRFAAHARVTFYFAYKQVLHEILVVLIASIVILLSLVFTEDSDASAPRTNPQSRQTLFIGFLVYYIVLMFFLLLLYTEPLHLAARYYFPRLYKYYIRYYNNNNNNKRRHLRPIVVLRADPVLEPVGGCLPPLALPYASMFTDISDRKLADEIHLAVVGVYHDPIVKLPVVITIIRNLVYISSLFLTLALLFNFYTSLNNVYLLLIIALSFAYIYFQVKYITIAIFYLSLFRERGCYHTDSYNRKRNRWLIAFIVLQSILNVVYIACSYQSVYITYFNSVNSTHSMTIATVYIVSSITMAILAAILMVSNTFDKFADPLIACAIEERKRVRRTLSIQ